MNDYLKISLSAAFAFLANIEGVLSLFERLLKNKVMETGNHIIWLQLLSIILIFILSLYFLTKIQYLKDKLELFLIISQIRDIISFDEAYGKEIPVLLPNETLESYLSRTPSSKYLEKLQKEIKDVRTYAYEQLNHLKVSEVEALIMDAYKLTNK